MLKLLLKKLKLLSMIIIPICLAFMIYLPVVAQTSQQDIIKEFEQIMEIPPEERTVTEWERAIEIIFQIAFDFKEDISKLFDKLKSEIEKYELLNDEKERVIEAMLNIKQTYIPSFVIFSNPSINIKSGFSVGINFATFVTKWFMVGGGIKLSNLFVNNDIDFGFAVIIGFSF